MKTLNNTDAVTDYAAHMTTALALAAQIISAAPNPRVACVLVDGNNKLLATGWHKAAGLAHAEAMALQQARAQGISDFRNVTAIVTLEPCSFVGRTPACSDALITAGVSRVVIASLDPNPRVAGQGVARLEAAGIEVLCLQAFAALARALNAGYFKRHESGLPYVKCKLAMSMDGRTAMANGESKWISSPQARSGVQRLRAESCAIITGIETVLMDNPSLNVRIPELELDPHELSKNADALKRQPLRVVLDSAQRTPVDAKLLGGDAQVRIYTCNNAAAKAAAEYPANVHVLPLECQGERVQLRDVLESLVAEDSCNQVLVEAGPTLSGAFLQAGLVDELIIYVAPKLLGSDAMPLLQLPGLLSLSEQIELELLDLQRVGPDFRVNLAVKK